MPIYVGSQKIKDIYYGGVKIGKIYRGNTLVYTSLAYPSDTIVYESSTAGTSTVELEKGIYEVYCIAGGSGGAAVGGTSTARAVAVGGASGSGFIGKVRLNEGTYRIVVGAGGAGSSGAYRYTATSVKGGDSFIGNLVIARAGDVSLEKLITAYGGESSTTNGNNIAIAGNGGAVPSVNTSIISQTLNKAGNQGNIVRYWATSTAGASVYGSYGAGGASTALNGGGTHEDGSSGYIKIVYKGN
jgi:hypothetical protein